MTPLQSQIVELTGSLTNAILETIRSASLKELMGSGAGQIQQPMLAGRMAALPVGPRLLPSGRLHRRSLDEIAKTLDSVASLLKRHPQGLRAEQIRNELGLMRKELPRVLKDGLTNKVIRAKGEKRATTYFAP
jgi:hypothetical protein